MKTIRNHIRRFGQFIVNSMWLWIPLVLLIVVVSFYPFRFVLEFDPDEGNNLILANLINDAVKLYSDVWTDHPPLIPLFLSTIFRIFGQNTTVARLFILLISCLLMGTAVFYLHSFWGKKHALIGAAMLILIPNFSRLSVSVMIGLPSIAFGVLSFVSLAFWHRLRSPKYVILSALLLSISVMIKIYTLFLAGIFVIGILFSEPNKSTYRGSGHLAIRSAALWFASFSIAVILIAVLFIGSDGISQIFSVHFSAMSNQQLESWSEELSIFDLESFWPLLTLCFIASFNAFESKQYNVLYLTAWISMGWLFLTRLAPHWYHHELLVTVPASILASIPVGDTIDIVCQKRLKGTYTLGNLLALVTTSLAFVWFLYLRVPPTVEEYSLDFPNIQSPTTEPDEKQEMLAIISDYAEETELIVTDRPMFAFRTGIAVPPKLAVVSGKRYLTGELNEDDFLQIIQSEKPEQVALTRFAMPEVVSYLEARYRLEFSSAPYLLFIREDIPRN